MYYPRDNGALKEQTADGKLVRDFVYPQLRFGVYGPNKDNGLVYNGKSWVTEEAQAAGMKYEPEGVKVFRFFTADRLKDGDRMIPLLSVKDKNGRDWQIALNVHQMKRIRAALGIDLVNVITLDKEGVVKVDMIDRIANDPCLLVDILWVLVEEQAKAINVTDEQFGAALAGESIENATKAFLDELVDFFPGAKRLFLKKAVELSRKYTGDWTQVLEKALNDPELEKRVAESMRSSASSPESSV